MFKGPGGMGDMMGLMKQAQKMKKDMKKLKKEISKTNITVSNDDNSITLILNGDHLIQKITLSDDLDVSNKDKLAIMLKEILNKGSKEVDKMSSEKLSVLSKQGMPTDLPF
tara:strand:- start:1200 stop:1532 length:333 start_codon:yes stop_codon:yes gene_type:complete